MNHAPGPWDEMKSRFLDYRDSGSPQVTSMLFTELNRLFCAYFRSRLQSNEDIGDLVQDVLLKIHINRFAYRDELPLRTWVYTIASRTLIDHWRRRGRQTQRIHDDFAVETLPDPSDEAKSVEDRNQCEMLLAHLTENERKLLRAYAVNDLSLRDIAETHGTSEGAIKVRVHRIYKNLRKISGVGVVLALFFAATVAIMKPARLTARISLQQSLLAEVN